MSKAQGIATEKSFALLFLLFIGIHPHVNAQRWAPVVKCSTDIVTVKQANPLDYIPNNIDTLNTKSFEIVRCITRSNLGFRMDLGFSNYYYGTKTTSWLGQHGGPLFSFIALYNKLNLGIRFKPATISPKKEMEFSYQNAPDNS